MCRKVDDGTLFFIVAIIVMGCIAVTGIIMDSHKSSIEYPSQFYLDSMKMENEKRTRWIDSVKESRDIMIAVPKPDEHV